MMAWRGGSLRRLVHMARRWRTARNTDGAAFPSVVATLATTRGLHRSRRVRLPPAPPPHPRTSAGTVNTTDILDKFVLATFIEIGRKSLAAFDLDRTKGRCGFGAACEMVPVPMWRR